MELTAGSNRQVAEILHTLILLNMETIDFKKLGVQELNMEEMGSINGGSFWSTIGDAIRSVWDWVFNHNTNPDDLPIGVTI